MGRARGLLGARLSPAAEYGYKSPVLSKYWLTLYRTLALLAVVASSLLYVHYLDPGDSDICGGASGCEAVRRGSFSYFGVPYLNVPLLGMLAYGVLLLDSLGVLTSARLQRMRAMAGVGGVLALVLVLVQALVIQAFCVWCMMVDAAAVGVAFTGLALHREGARQQPLLRPWSWVALLVGSVVLPLTWHAVKPTPGVPRLVAELYRPGKINVVEFADFQCPHCRRLHTTLSQLRQEYGERVHFERLNVPLPNHVHAESAAKAAVCAAAQGREEEMADRLFEGQLGEEHYRAYASDMGLDLPAFERCLADPATLQVIEQDVARFRASELRGLPTTFVGEQKIAGARPLPVFKEAFERAILNETAFAMPGWAFLLSCVGFVVAVCWFGRMPTVRRPA